ncbi:MAG: heavy metal translocating P-type ATPase [Lachnospiraceae bacterium]|nr:heavy metal translocating P-type ATPase [Lachnospiraceae bacterium]
MEQFNVEGMSCAACVAHVEKAVRSVEGVEDVSVSLLTNSMTVEGNADIATICLAVDKAGYHASKKGAAASENETSGLSAKDLEDKETPKMVRRFITSVVFLLPLMYVSMGHMMWGWPLPFFLEGNHIGMGLFEMLLCICVMIINRKFFISGITGALHGAPNMDTLVAMGSGVSFLYSVYGLFAMTYFNSIGNDDMVSKYMMEFYFESAAMILTLITIGKTLESYSKGKTTNALKGLMDLAPETAIILEGDKEVERPVSSISVGEIFIVRPGMSVPLDGIIIEGESAIDESALTGESIPVDKNIGDEVSGGTINQSGFLKCKTTRIGSDTTLSKIIQMVSDAAATKAPIAKIADQVAGVFVPAVLVVALITAIIWLFSGAEVAFSLERAIAVLVISCPCALGLATPVAIMVGNGKGAKNGILYKTASSLEAAGRANIVVLDKTGTITTGEPVVTDVVSNIDSNDLITIASSLERKSEHPLAKAVCKYGEGQHVNNKYVLAFENLSGQGIKGTIEGMEYFAGKEDFITSIVGKDVISSFKVQKNIDSYLAEGKTPLYFAGGTTLLGAIFVADKMKEESPKAIAELNNMGIHVVMLTGDNEKTAASIGSKAGVNEIVANVLPDEKEAVVKELQTHGKVIMVGDGINDAPALTRADVGFAIGAGTDIAIDAADVVLVNSKLSDVPAAIRLSKYVIRNIHENLFWAFIYNVIGIPLAAGFWIPITGWSLTPMFGAAAMSLSSFCVVMNALRLNLINVHSAKAFINKNEDISKPFLEKKETKMEETNMTKEIAIDGMMCEMCEKHVRKALEGLDGVSSVAKVSHEENVAVIETVSEVSEDAIKAAIEGAGYTFKSVK